LKKNSVDKEKVESENIGGGGGLCGNRDWYLGKLPKREVGEREGATAAIGEMGGGGG